MGSTVFRTGTLPVRIGYDSEEITRQGYLRWSTQWETVRLRPEQRLETALVGSANGIRTRVSALRGRCPRPLDDSAGENSEVWSANFRESHFRTDGKREQGAGESGVREKLEERGCKDHENYRRPRGSGNASATNCAQ